MAFRPLYAMERVALTSGVEAAQLSCSGRRHARYPGEHCSILEVDSVLELGRLAALRFLEWASGNPQGVVSLPTGRAFPQLTAGRSCVTRSFRVTGSSRLCWLNSRSLQALPRCLSAK